ncbi:MAG: hypothetical protein IPI87_20095 [Betaproteobacteria bacterium]|nr:hypothetical protein [Betaproteobacteria bacterium]
MRSRAPERAAALAPDVAAAHAGLGDVLRQADRLEHAAIAYRKAVALAPGDADALNKLATVERTMRNDDIAETLLREACARAPGHPYARVNRGTLELQLGRPEAGKALLQSALGDARLPPDAKEEAADALAMLAERTALEGPRHRPMRSRAASSMSRGGVGRTAGRDATSSRYAPRCRGAGHDRAGRRRPVALRSTAALAPRADHPPSPRHGAGPDLDRHHGRAYRDTRPSHASRVRTHATLAKVLRDLAPGAPAGAWRIAFVYLAVLDIHPFAAGHGRSDAPCCSTGC